ncbi:glutamate-1-semialdehyde 2,1-aminomutase [Roseivirga pacifica]|uniref:glutamate-1-semialdehyde 2,1-aminomutase n=1 Tax=Roseivirga pacifica TaxID=1267423 RepID=UPI0020952706|nr:glutamate-1-semialdehyde 2,1-aminomutase [Roseivirga pacifica]MCO6357735.1 glutamate-1-semialdehyde 2,1-aminomutase [Roseivirga pacifica]MCO6365988.1 glutamate-1-semialdehyde 2,1-aminomutase [Roseivirga pacifica]MCO6371316.1 glutamate-1-semialdehyde 2,1-aminomutase [Roseivirga pacifica]MCO6375513.1 glutamate-1-semialdehyde 2,1-aminomutase [Roseivirga pacifica]MCO6378694.1 glutamate-1-semialdehyde 2,1-aminomutase [Roseivirga pacifica]
MPESKRSTQLFEEAQNYIPGGVNSPVRAFKAVGGNPLFIKRAHGAYMIDEDDNQYIDLINSWGPMILGHGNEQIQEAVAQAIKDSLSFGAPTAMEVKMAELICDMVPSIDKVRMVNSGTEATMSAIRLARGYTGKSKIIKFEGCYHGHGDSFLIAAGSGAITLGEPNSPGVTKGVAQDTITVPFNDLNKVHEAVAASRGNIAAIIVEPVAGNMGCVLPKDGFLEGLRSICDAEGIVLIFDEVMTGFRLSKAGAQGVFNVQADITTLGKIIGGGMPVGAYGGKREIMDFVSPVGPVYQAGTLSGNPVAMAAGYAMLSQINENETLYNDLALITSKLENGFQDILDELSLPYTINRIGSMISLFFTDQKVVDFDTAKSSNLSLFGKYFRNMLDNGVYLPPSQFETYFVSTAITKEIADDIIDASRKSLKALL